MSPAQLGHYPVTPPSISAKKMIRKIISFGDLINTPSIAILFLAFHNAHMTVAQNCDFKVMLSTSCRDPILQEILQRFRAPIPPPPPGLLLYSPKQTWQLGRQRKYDLPSPARRIRHISHFLSTSYTSGPPLSTAALDMLAKGRF